MAYDRGLAERIGAALAGTPGFSEKKMFGGVGFLIDGNMACGVSGESMIVRISPDEYGEALSDPFVRPFDMTGRPMKGWVVVDAGGIASAADLERWAERGVAFARTLPPK